MKRLDFPFALWSPRSIHSCKDFGSQVDLHKPTHGFVQPKRCDGLRDRNQGLSPALPEWSTENRFLIVRLNS